MKDILIFSRKISSSLIKSVDCVRVGVSVVGLEVPHAHLHLIPFINEKDKYLKSRTKKQKISLVS
mgnify:CR=1 FL=1